MEPIASLLRCHAERIASVAAEPYDAQDLLPVLRDLISEVADRIGDGADLDIAVLRDAGLDDDIIARILRSVLFGFIEALRPELDEDEFGPAVVALRRCIHPVIPHPDILPENVDFYHRLLKGESEGLEPDHGRLMDLSHDLISAFRDIVYVHDLNGMMLYVNQSGQDLLGFTPDDLLNGLSVYDVVVPEHVDLIEARIESPGAVSRSPYTVVVYAKNGERVPLEITTRGVTQHGQIVGVVGLARDLRLARRLEDEISRSHAYIDAVAAHAPFGVMRTDAEFMIIEVNTTAAAMIGAPGTYALSGVPVLGLCRGDGSALRDILNEALEKQEVIRQRFSQTTSCGTHLNCDLTVVPLCVHPGRVDGLLIFMVDLTGQRS